MTKPAMTNEPASKTHPARRNVDLAGPGEQSDPSWSRSRSRQNSATRRGLASAGALIVVATACGPDPQKVSIGEDPSQPATTDRVDPFTAEPGRLDAHVLSVWA